MKIKKLETFLANAGLRNYLFVRLTTDYLKFLVPHYIAEGKTYLTIAVGCTGGRHRSVAIAEELAKRLQPLSGVDVRVRHRDVAIN